MESSGNNDKRVKAQPVTAEMIQKALEQATDLWKVHIEEDIRRYGKALLN